MKREQMEMERQEQERLAAEEAAAKFSSRTAEDGNALADASDMGEAITIPSELFDSVATPAKEAPSMAGLGGAGRATVSAAPEEKAEKQFEVTFRVTGGFEILRTLNQYMKENGIAYTVLEQKKI